MTRIYPVIKSNDHANNGILLAVTEQGVPDLGSNRDIILPTRITYLEQRLQAFNAGRAVSNGDEHNKYITDILTQDDYGNTPLTYKDFEQYKVYLQNQLPVPKQVELQVQIINPHSCKFCFNNIPFTNISMHTVSPNLIYHLLPDCNIAVCEGTVCPLLNNGLGMVVNYIY